MAARGSERPQDCDIQAGFFWLKRWPEDGVCSKLAETDQKLGVFMRVKPHLLSRYPWWLRPFFWNQKRKYGEVLDAALLWGRSPKLFAGVAFLYGMIDRRSSPINPTLRSLVTVLVSQINNCSFCVDLNSATLLRRGVRVDMIEALPRWRQSDLFSSTEKAALDFADAMTRYDRGVEDDVFTTLRQHFDDDAIIELAALIAFQNLSSKFNSALALPAQGFCPLPELSLSGSDRSQSDNAADDE